MSIALAVIALLPGCDASGPKFKSTDITGAPYGVAFSLAGHDGRRHGLEGFRGKVVVLFFGYTHCPDVCPTTLAEMAGVLRSLGPQADHVQMLFMTLDPERDTQDVLAKYVPAFHPAFLGLYGDVATTRSVAKEFKVFFEKRPGSNPGEYTVDHSSQSYVFDTKGRLRLFVRHGRIQDLIGDIRTLLEEG